MSDSADDLLTPAEVADQFGVAPRTVSRWADEGKLPVAVLTAGGHRRFRRSDVEALIAAGSEVAGGDHGAGFTPPARPLEPPCEEGGHSPVPENRAALHILTPGDVVWSAS